MFAPECRRRPTKAIQAAVLKRQRHLCNACARSFSECGPVEWDHWQALSLGGNNGPGNWQALGRPCHRTKSARDLGMKAKAERIARKLAGAWPKAKRPLKGRGFDRRFIQPVIGRPYLKAQYIDGSGVERESKRRSPQ